MNPLWILAAGMAVVVGGVLLLRLHAFLALILGALVVAFLTSTANLTDFAKMDARNEATKRLKDKTLEPREVDEFVAQRTERTFTSLASKTPIERIAKGFGDTCTGIGILIAMAAIIGKCLLDSGAADRVVRWALGLLGEARAPLAFLASGFMLGIPVFFDTVFYLMLPLGKAMALRTGKNYLLYIMAIGAGGTMAHSLVPPTPGPLFVAELFQVAIGEMILVGMVIGSICGAVGYFYAHWANRKWEVPLRESIDMPLADLEALAARDEKELPPTWLSMLPIVLPVVLIGGATIIERMLKTDAGVELEGLQAQILYVSSILGNKNIALIISAAIALATLAWSRKSSRDDLAKAVQTSLASGGVIILITAAGGAFGKVLLQTGIGNEIDELRQAYNLPLIPMAFFVTALVRTAQGSATVAMITAAGILAPLAISADLGFHPVYLAVAIGCGSKPIAWMNDSGFWVVCKMSGMTEGETLRYWTPMTVLMGVVGLLATMGAAAVLPFPFAR